MTMSQNKQIAAELFARFTASDIDGVLALMADDVTWRLPGKPELSRAAGVYDKARLRGLFDRMVAALEKSLAKQVERGKLDETAAKEIAARVSATDDLHDLHECDLVLESVVVVRLPCAGMFMNVPTAPSVSP